MAKKSWTIWTGHSEAGSNRENGRMSDYAYVFLLVIENGCPLINSCSFNSFLFLLLQGLLLQIRC